MKPFFKYTLAAISITAIIAVLAIVYSKNEAGRMQMTCTGLEIKIKGEHHFVNKKDIKEYIEKGYGAYIGQRIDKMDLTKIEKILDRRSAILKSEAYTTPDGRLNIQITQREPAVRFQKEGYGFYADERGFIFPLQNNYTSYVPIVDGYIPLIEGPDFKGAPSDTSEIKWLGKILSLTGYMKHSGIWEKNIVQINVSKNGDLILIPVEGREKFIFGKPMNIEDKFERIEDYYKSIIPYKGKDYYSVVNVKYDGQIVCRK
jgi:cell division protein FtsQ